MSSRQQLEFVTPHRTQQPWFAAQRWRNITPPSHSPDWRNRERRGGFRFGAPCRRERLSSKSSWVPHQHCGPAPIPVIPNLRGGSKPMQRWGGRLCPDERNSPHLAPKAAAMQAIPRPVDIRPSFSVASFRHTRAASAPFQGFDIALAFHDRRPGSGGEWTASSPLTRGKVRRVDKRHGVEK